MYGTTPIAYDTSVLKFNSGGKSLQCIGFTSASLIKDQYLAGTGSWSVVSQNGFPVSEKMLIALVQCLREADMAIVARYVYGSNTKPKLMALFPTDSRVEYKSLASLTMAELFFSGKHQRLSTNFWIIKYFIIF